MTFQAPIEVLFPKEMFSIRKPAHKQYKTSPQITFNSLEIESKLSGNCFESK